MEVKQNQAVQSEEKEGLVQAGAVEEEVQAVETADTGKEEETTVQDEGLIADKKAEGITVEDIMSEDAQDGEAPSVAEKVPGTPIGVQKKIDKEVRRRKEAEEREREALSKLQALEAQKAISAERPKVPLIDDFETTEEYQEAMDRYQDETIAYNLQKRTVAEQEAVEKQRLEKNVTRFQESAVRMRAKYADFDDLVTTGENVFGNLSSLILESDYAPEIAYFLRKNPSRLEELKDMSIVKANQSIGELSAQFKAAPKKTTKAPKSLNTVKGDTETTIKNLYEIKDSNEWFKERNRQIYEKKKAMVQGA